MTRRKTAFSDRLRELIDASDMSRYRIHKLTGIDQATLSRFANGHGYLSMPTVNRIVEVLDLDLVPRVRRKGR